MAPGVPAIRIHAKEAVLTTKRPGVIWDINNVYQQEIAIYLQQINWLYI